MEARDELLIEDRDLAVEYENLRSQLGDGGGQLAEARGVLDGAPADQADVRAILVDDQAPACVQTR